MGDGQFDDVGVVVVTLNARPYIERCLESVREYLMVVVDHGSSDGTPELVLERFPDAKLVRQENRGLAAGWNRGMQELRSCRYVLLLNADAWVADDAVERLVVFADSRRDVAVVGPRLLNPDGTLQPSIRGFPTTWRLATEYLGLKRLAPRSRLLGAASGAGASHDSIGEVEWLTGAAMLVRREAVEDVGRFDDSFFLFSEEVDWCYRSAQRGWKIVFYPHARVVHVGEGSHGGRLARELARSNLRYLAKHHGEHAARRARVIILIGVMMRAAVRRGWKRRVYRETAQWLGSHSVIDLLAPEERDEGGDSGAKGTRHDGSV